VVTEPLSRSLYFTAAEDGPAPANQSIGLRNDGAGTLRWEAIGDTDTWLALSPDSGSVLPGNSTSITVAVSHVGLTNGTYQAQVVLRNKDRPDTGTNSDADTINVSLIVQAFSFSVSRNPLIADAGEPVRVNVTSSVAADSAKLHYRRGGKTVFVALPMVAQGDTVFTLNLPGTLFGARGAEFFVRVFAAGSSVAEPDLSVSTPFRIPVDVLDAPSRSISAEQHTMIAVPLRTGGMSAYDAIEDDLGTHDLTRWRLGCWFPDIAAYNEYPSELGAPVDAGFGFWLITKEISVFHVGGRSVLPEAGDTTVAIPLDGVAGGLAWNQIGHPFDYNVRWDEVLVRDGNGKIMPVTGADQTLVENAAYTYIYKDGTGEYEETIELHPWQGYFVANLSGEDLDLLIPARESSILKNAPARPGPSPSEGEWELRLIAHSGAAYSGRIIAGARAQARDGWDSFDRYRPPAPTVGGPTLGFQPGRGMPVPDELRADIRAPSDGVSTWEVTVTVPEDREVLLLFESDQAMPEGMSAYLVDDVASTTHPVSDGTA